MNAEEKRLEESRKRKVHWKRWGPYLSERQWGTVREDYSPDGTAWEFFPHDHARSRAYRWGEDGIMGISDRHQLVCFALAFWNGRDPILKERLFGLTPTNSYMKALYKYPHTENSSKKTAAGIGLISSMSCWTRGPSPKTAISTSSPSTPRRAPKTS